ncbi:MAG: Hpt domain-containing protein [Cyanobacteria bacterium CRU_2_1]|nr:Hpt domain-containing protein [Cyanobacteria bacterium CRU_2_1]
MDDAIDIKQLQSYGMAIEDKADNIVRQLVQIYLEDAPDLLQTIELAIYQEDVALLKRAVHNLKGSSASLGAMTLASICQELETLAKTGRFDHADKTFSRLKTEYVRVETALQTQNVWT